MNEYYPYNYKGYPVGLKYPWLFPMPSERERDRRWGTICKWMGKNKFDCLIVSSPWGYMPSPSNQIYYISNYVPYFSTGTYIVFPIDAISHLIVSNSIGPQFVHCASETSWIKNIIGSLHPEQEVVTRIKDLKLEKGRLGIVGLKKGEFPASAYIFLRENLPSAKLEDATWTLNEAMNEVSRISEEELKFLKKTAEIHDLSFQAVAQALKPAITEYQLWMAAENAIVNNGGWYPHFILAASGPAPIFTRAPASHYKLKKGDAICFEINVTVGGITSQTCYSLSLGKPEKKIEEMHQFCEELYDFSLKELEKNRTFREIDLDTINRIHDAGYEPMTPQIHIYDLSIDTPLDSPPQPGDYFTVHPNICNKEYTAGAKFGDTVRINKDGKVERLQKTPAKLHVIQS